MGQISSQSGKEKNIIQNKRWKKNGEITQLIQTCPGCFPNYNWVWIYEDEWNDILEVNAREGEIK